MRNLLIKDRYKFGNYSNLSTLPRLFSARYLSTWLSYTISPYLNIDIASFWGHSPGWYLLFCMLVTLQNFIGKYLSLQYMKYSYKTWTARTNSWSTSKLLFAKVHHWNGGLHAQTSLVPRLLPIYLRRNLGLRLAQTTALVPRPHRRGDGLVRFSWSVWLH